MDKDNKRLVIMFVSALLLGGLISAAIYLYKHRQVEVNPVEVGMDVYSAIPTDAVVIYRAATVADCIRLTEEDNALLQPYQQKRKSRIYQKMKAISAKVENCPVVISLHYSSKNHLTGLCAIYLDETAASENLMESLNASKVKQNIYRTGGEKVYAAKVGSCFLMCENVVVLEAALRHLADKVSMNDIDAFRNLAESYTNRSQVLFINHGQIGKVFSGMGARKSLTYSSFFGGFTDWTALTLSGSAKRLSATGEHFNNMPGEYSDVFERNDCLVDELYSFLPAETAIMFRISTPEFRRYVKNHTEYIKANANSRKYRRNLFLYDSLFQEKIKLYEKTTGTTSGMLMPSQWLDSLSPKELVFAAYRSADSLDYVTMLKVTRKFDYARLYSKTLSKDEVVEIRPFQYEGYLSCLLGKVFKTSRNSYYMTYKDWYVIGPRKYLENLLDGEYDYFSLKDYVEPAGFGAEGSALQVLISLTELQKSIPTYFNERYSNAIQSLIESGNYGFLNYRLTPTDNSPQGSLDLYIDQMEKLPAPAFIEGIVPITGDTIVTLPQGPFKIKNHLNGKDGYLKQYPNCKLQLLNEKRMGIWTIDFDRPIAGYVGQIDCYKNDKLQMLFCAGNRMYCLDRTGHFVKGFPVRLSKEVEMGPIVYDFDGNREYTVFVMNTDNSFSMYDIEGKKIEGWNDIKTAEKVIEMPELMTIGGSRYWIVRSAGRLYIYDFHGNWIDENNPRYIIRRDSPVKVIDEGTVLVQCLDDREYFVDLATGKFKRSK